MENCLRHLPNFIIPSSSSALFSSPKPQLACNFPHKAVVSSPFRPLYGIFDPLSRCGRGPMKIVASAGATPCEFTTLSSNSPLKLKTPVGKFLGGVLQNHRQLFHLTVNEELRLLSDDREAAIARLALSAGSDEEVLHRRIAEIKENQCQNILLDIMYLLIFYKFSEIRVPLVPKLSRCIYNGRLEILPSKDWQLESIHSLGVLDLLKEHVTTLTGLKANCSVRETWAKTKIRHFMLAQIYVASILYGYFLKSVALRYHLDRSLSLGNDDLCFSGRTGHSFHDFSHYRFSDMIFGRRNNLSSVDQRQEEKTVDLKDYLMGFHPGSLQRCANLRSEEALKLIQGYGFALFGNEKCELVESDDVILTSFSSLRRLVMEAAAFGSFLWEAEDYIDNVYRLRDM
ncbi:UV-B-induced protein At3g17800, chloroplastic-like [Neltuma alba]|uniref:UV-B-induced protein At3g17800, chloroplastic-like n=1 Tax=Neltuma alba TaxID=207710 RepID=UPI0010A45F49|nr:UV-B-induced protein At3g17800, chloroplastic-like [Prosopis alba]XP_028787487.1 UV-B-induced protein At3g17800, chloroplastic-like [Prosopis alba]